MLSELDLDSALTLGVQPVGTVNGRGQSTLPRYLLDKAGKEIQVVGDLDNPNLETLIDLEPDLILTGQTKPELLALLKEIAPTVVTGNWGEPWKTVFNRSANVMNKEAEAKAFLARYDARLAEARSKLAKHQGEFDTRLVELMIHRGNHARAAEMHGSVVQRLKKEQPDSPNLPHQLIWLAEIENRARLHGQAIKHIQEVIEVIRQRTAAISQEDARANTLREELQVVGLRIDRQDAVADAQRAAVDEMRNAESQLKLQKRQMQQARERAARRAGTAARNVKDAGLPKIVAGKLKRDAQESAARADEVHSRRVDDARARLDAAERAVRDDDVIDLDLPKTEVPVGRTVLSATGLNIERDGRILFPENGIDLDIRGPERIALTGRNGAGKSTLLRMINGDIQPDAGTLTRGDGRIAYLSQRLDLLDEQRSVLENLMSWAPTLSITRRRHLLAQFLFQDNRIDLPVSVLSGGERLRATLACVLFAEPAPHLLLLDEPTNNLDLVSVAQLESALNAYRGAFIVVSHDQRFLDAIAIERRMTLPPE